MNISTALLLLLALISPQAWAALAIEGTRVIFHGDQRESALRLLNDSHNPILVQAWVDDGDPQGTPHNAGDVPAIPLPSLFRIEPGSAYRLRLMATYLPLPQDRESLFWLNLNEIPASATSPEENAAELKLQVRLQLKLFFRPAQIKADAGKRSAAQSFQLLKEKGALRLKVTNPTPFYAVYSRAEVEGAGKRTQPVELEMLAPFESKTFSLPKSMTWTPERLRFGLINDQGNEEITEITL